MHPALGTLIETVSIAERHIVYGMCDIIDFPDDQTRRNFNKLR